ncbi:MAG: transcriptional regulator [Bacteroidetes bacterium RIFCSPLOWO2_02_FULL_36_8]|nr:MAG: transcriptional regulator [Bacteroidetes bacterium RIFCSPLOWO2_02_FULL_36_8]OFY69627.1 MAG: transcriptional regulator [Bacteroidetes bacterium RIFCSPLOWO2_12_FULL_37_12]
MKTILLIEDNPDVRENTAEILELAGYKVHKAENGKTGVDLALQKTPDLIICDIMMPELDGYGVLHILSKSADTSTIPFIFLTAKTEKSDYRKGMNLGADDYITKPFDETDLLNAVEIRLKKSEKLRVEYKNDISGFQEFLKKARSVEKMLELSDGIKVVHFKKKQNVYTEGHYPYALYFLNKGNVKTYKTNEFAKEYITGLFKEGDFLGYVSLLENTAYIETSETLTESELLVIPKEDFLKLISSSHEVSNTFIKILSKNVKEKEERLLQLAYNSVRQRVAEALLMIFDRYENELQTKDGLQFSREDFASVAGTAIETLIRTLSEFKDEKLIDIQSGKIKMLSREKVQRLARQGF